MTQVQKQERNEFDSTRRSFMSKKIILSLALFGFLITGPVGAAVTDEDFVLSSTQNLVNLCSVAASDPRAKEAIQMCEGYMLGAYHYYLATNSGKNDMRLVCMPNPTPSRNQVAAMFVEWAKANPQYMKEAPVDSEFRFMSTRWPCKGK
jgi:Rap1a immunity proteins